MSVVISQVIGGLGNQMFQYAAGRSLALRHGCEVQLDTSDFAGYSLHQGFELATVFGIDFRQTDRETRDRLLGWRRYRLARRLLKRWPGLQVGQRLMVREPHFHYWPDWEFLTSPAYLSGYWQSERYFSNCADQIRQDFQFQKPLDLRSLEIAEEIRSGVSVSLHVRRGDYVSNPKTTAVHGLCGPPYYATAIEYLSDQIGPMRLFIFSDDIEWVRANLPLDSHPHTFVSHNKGADSWRDMLLMSLCQHHVIANSSFSWWGAWLNASPSKIVAAPKKWFANRNDTKDLFPSGWILL
jgi:hypothetical protein